MFLRLILEICRDVKYFDYIIYFINHFRNKFTVDSVHKYNSYHNKPIYFKIYNYKITKINYSINYQIELLYKRTIKNFHQLSRQYISYMCINNTEKSISERGGGVKFKKTEQGRGVCIGPREKCK